MLKKRIKSGIAMHLSAKKYPRYVIQEVKTITDNSTIVFKKNGCAKIRVN